MLAHQYRTAARVAALTPLTFRSIVRPLQRTPPLLLSSAAAYHSRPFHSHSNAVQRRTPPIVHRAVAFQTFGTLQPPQLSLTLTLTFSRAFSAAQSSNKTTDATADTSTSTSTSSAVTPAPDATSPTETTTLSTTPALTRSQRIWIRVKEEAHHYWHGTKLLYADIKVAAKLTRRVLHGHELNRRERKQLTRTSADILRLVPFLVIVIVPFMEFALPVLLKFFPNMLPSTYLNAKGEEAKLKKQLAAKIEMAKFLQDTTALMASQLLENDTNAIASEARRLTVSSFQSLMQKVKSGESIKNDDILKVSSLFDEDFTLEHLSREQLAAMCRLVDLRVFGNEWVLRHKLNRKLDALRDDDKQIKKEGIDSLSVTELQEACRARGIYSQQSVSYMKRKLNDWLELSLEHDVPISLLVLSRAFSQSLAHGTVDRELTEDLASMLKHIPDVVVQDTQATIVDLSSDPKEKLELIMKEEKETSTKTKKGTQPSVVGLTELKERIEDIQEENDEIEEDIDEALEENKKKKVPKSLGTTAPAAGDKDIVDKLTGEKVEVPVVAVEEKKVRKVDRLNDKVEELLDRVQEELEQHEQTEAATQSPATPATPSTAKSTASAIVSETKQAVEEVSQKKTDTQHVIKQ